MTVMVVNSTFSKVWIKIALGLNSSGQCFNICLHQVRHLVTFPNFREGYNN